MVLSQQLTCRCSSRYILPSATLSRTSLSSSSSLNLTAANIFVTRCKYFSLWLTWRGAARCLAVRCSQHQRRPHTWTMHNTHSAIGIYCTVLKMYLKQHLKLQFCRINIMNVVVGICGNVCSDPVEQSRELSAVVRLSILGHNSSSLLPGDTASSGGGEQPQVSDW